MSSPSLMQPNEMRTLTVCELFRPLKWSTQFVPWIRLSGKWLAQAGFHPGGKVTVRVENDSLIIEPFRERSVQ